LNSVVITRKGIGIDGHNPDNTQICIIYAKLKTGLSGMFILLLRLDVQRWVERALEKPIASLQRYDGMSYSSYA
jgi:hypothetical protein